MVCKFLSVVCNEARTRVEWSSAGKDGSVIDEPCDVRGSAASGSRRGW